MQQEETVTVAQYRRLRRDLTAAREAGASVEAIDAHVAALDSAWLALSAEERQLEEPLPYNSVGMRAYCQRYEPLTLVDVSMTVFDPDHVPVVDSAGDPPTDPYVKVLQLRVSGQPRDRSRAPFVDFVKNYSIRTVLRDVRFAYVVLMHGSSVVSVAAVEPADWVHAAVRRASADAKVERWGVWLGGAWVTWDDGEEWTGTRSAAEAEASKVPGAEARPYGSIWATRSR